MVKKWATLDSIVSCTILLVAEVMRACSAVDSGRGLSTQGRKQHEADQTMETSRATQDDWQMQITEKVNFLETKMISMDNGLAGAGENIKKILEHLLKNSVGVITPPRKKQSRGLPLSPVNENQRSAISEIARTQRPILDHMSPRSHSQMHIHGGGVGRGEDDETEGNDNEVVDLADEAPYTVPSTQLKKGNANFGKGKGIVVIDSQSGGEDDDTRGRGALMEEYDRRRLHQSGGQEDRRQKSKGTSQRGRRRLANPEIGEDNLQNTKILIQNSSEEEGDDSFAEMMSPPRRSQKRTVVVDGGREEGTTDVAGRPRNGSGRNTTQAAASVGTPGGDQDIPRTQTYRRLKSLEHGHSGQPNRGIGVAATEAPQSMHPRKNGVSHNA